jgi:hypothetical protein
MKLHVVPLQVTQQKVCQPIQSIKADALHVDTVKISHACRFNDLPPPDVLEKQGFELTFKRRKNSNNILTAHLKTSSYHLTLIKSDRGYCGVIIELSIAKYHSSNGLGTQTDADIDYVFREIEIIIGRYVGLKFDPKTAKISRLDVNADFQVGEVWVRSYLNALSRPSTRFIPAEFGDTTRQFYNKSRKLLVYGKYSEVEKQMKKGKATPADLKEAEGLLRVEIGLRKPPISRLATKLKVAAEGSNLINLSVAKQIVTDGLHELRLDMTKISHEKLFRLMSENFGTDAPLMLGIIKYREVYGDDFWKIFGWSQATYYRKIKKLKDANLWHISPDEDLPALEI